MNHKKQRRNQRNKINEEIERKTYQGGNPQRLLGDQSSNEGALGGARVFAKGSSFSSTPSKIS